MEAIVEIVEDRNIAGSSCRGSLCVRVESSWLVLRRSGGGSDEVAEKTEGHGTLAWRPWWIMAKKQVGPFAQVGVVFAQGSVERALEAGERGDLAEAGRLLEAAERNDSHALEREDAVDLMVRIAKFHVSMAHFLDGARWLRRGAMIRRNDVVLNARWAATSAAAEHARELVVPGEDGGRRHTDDPLEIRRYHVISFAHEVARVLNYRIATPGPYPVLDYLNECGFLSEARGDLLLTEGLESFTRLGVYRWAGDPLASDTFTRWIRSFKTCSPNLATHLGRALAERLLSERRQLAAADVVVPVPGDPARLAERGFNPPGLLAEQIEYMLGLPLVEALQKVGAPRARELSRAEVFANFRTIPNAQPLLTGRSVLLVDDVATRGYTLCACAGRLKELGATRIDAIVLAQSITSRREAEWAAKHRS